MKLKQKKSVVTFESISGGLSLLTIQLHHHVGKLSLVLGDIISWATLTPSSSLLISVAGLLTV